jgi:phosphopantothenoylcysteine decarboxylase / phosphopantothenate---cysteine ligase
MSLAVFLNKRIVLGVTGSISVYKAVDLASKLTQAGAFVDVIMSEAAQQFVTPLTFQSVTGRTVYTDLWQAPSGGLSTHIAHVGLAHGADLIAIIPATANTLAKLAHGMADDLLTVTALAGDAPVVIAPAMDGTMYEHPSTQANLKTLKARGVIEIKPEKGRFASGLEGIGRLPETPNLLGKLRLVLARNGALSGRQIVVTAGGTREALDPVRFIGNRSSGKQGYAIAQACLDAGAQVTLISSADLPIPVGARLVKVESTQSLLDAVLKHTLDTDALIMAAAVADFRPHTIAEQKIKKQDGMEGITLELTRTADILLAVKEQRAKVNSPRIVVGFAAESQDVLVNAQSKLERKALDMMVANDITALNAGFAVDTNRVTFLFPDGTQEPQDLMSKDEVGRLIVERLAVMLRGTDD